LIKPVLLSTAIHGLIFAVIVISALIDRPGVIPPDTVSIRIMTQVGSSRSAGRPQAASPSESHRQIREAASIPLTPGTSNTFSTIPVTPALSEARREIALTDVDIANPEQPAINDFVKANPIASIDPLAGLEQILPGMSDVAKSTGNPWSLSWANGKERGILSFPVIDMDDFPEETGKLLNILVRVRVSPQGDVISAEVDPPGSGDIRIDRYLHNAALQLLLEPWPDDEGIQNAYLRLLFVDGNQ
jgi:hypothetical protein